MSDAQFPAGWYDDPMGRAEQRYYDGAAWTDKVSTGGVSTTDPLQEPATPTFDADDGVDATTIMRPADFLPAADMSASATPPAFTAPAMATPVAAPAGMPTADGETGTGTAGLSGFLDSLGDVARKREAPELPLALGGVGGALVGAGIIALIGQNGSQGTILGGAVVAFAVALAAALKLLGDQPWLRTAATACGAAGLFGLAAGLILGGDTISENAPGLFLLLAGVLHLIMWVAPGFRGRPLMLGGGVLATTLGLALLVAGGENCDFFQENCNPFEDAANQVGLSTGAGVVMIVIGAGLLFAVRKLDTDGYHGTAETIAAAAIIVLIFGAIAMSVDLGATGNSLFVIAVGLGLGIVGHMGKRRALTWSGAAMVAGGVISLVTNLITTNDATVTALIVIVIGAALVGLPRFVQLQTNN